MVVAQNINHHMVSQVHCRGKVGIFLLDSTFVTGTQKFAKPWAAQGRTVVGGGVWMLGMIGSIAGSVGRCVRMAGCAAMADALMFGLIVKTVDGATTSASEEVLASLASAIMHRYLKNTNGIQLFHVYVVS